MAATKNIRNRRFGAWKVIKPSLRPAGVKTPGQFWLCRCICGNKEVHSGARLRAGRIKRGCIHCAGKTHGKQGKGCSQTYNSWRGMRGRCLDPSHIGYKYYGGKGIKICKRWVNSFPNFLKDMGERPKGKTLDRRKSNGHYSKKNCRWADRKTQARAARKLTDEQISSMKTYHVGREIMLTLEAK